MKSFLLPICILMLAAACGKKAEVKDPTTPEVSTQPTKGEIYFKALKELDRVILADDVDGLKNVIRDSVDINEVQFDGETLLTLVIKKNSEKIRNYLIERKLLIEKKNIYGETPLIVAVNAGKLNSVERLVDAGVDLERKNKYGDTALIIAIKKSLDDIAFVLVQGEASIDAFDRSNRTAVRLAQEYPVPRTRELMRQRPNREFGAPDLVTYKNILIQGDKNKLNSILSNYPAVAVDDAYASLNPLAILVDAGNENLAIESARLLLDYKANVNGPKDADITPLLKATLKEKKSFAALYLERKADTESQDKDGKSALIHAVELNNSELVDILLSFSAAEKYTIRKNGKKINFNACETAKKVEKDLKTEEEKAEMKKIKKSLDCSPRFWPF